MKIRLASGNKDKAREFHELLGGRFEILPATLPTGVEIAETGETFAENARQKAEGYAAYYPNEWILAEDSGLAVDLLDGAPGIYSARYGGVDLDYPGKFMKLWEELRSLSENTNQWTAQFVSVIVLLSPEGQGYTYRGECPGLIAPEARGEGGFGYDPIFFSEKLGKTLGEVSDDTKNEISHRANAVAHWLADWEDMK